MQLLTDAAVKKMAKKSLKRQDSGQMKLKALAKTVAEKHDDLTVQSVKEIIQSSSKFHIHPDGKMVTLLKNNKRKRSSVSSKEGDAGGDDEPFKQKESQTKTQKKSKKNKKKTNTGEGDNLTSAEAQSWRQQHKIVVLPAQDGAGGAASALPPRSSVANESTYFPWTSFAHAQSLSSSSLHTSLLDHCVTANGFAKPSPIQAQSWPLLVAQRDVVGIAETGTCVLLLLCSVRYCVVASYWVACLVLSLVVDSSYCALSQHSMRAAFSSRPCLLSLSLS